VKRGSNQPIEREGVYSAGTKRVQNKPPALLGRGKKAK